MAAMQFRLRTLLGLFVVLWSSLAVFDLWGILVFVAVVCLAICIARSWWALIGLLCLLVLVPFLFSAWSCARENGRRAQCNNNLRNLALALHEYCELNGSLPPAYVADKNGRPMHSCAC